MLTRCVAALRDAGQRRRTNRVIIALSVEFAGLLPDVIRRLSPAESSPKSLGVQGLIERSRVELACSGLRDPHALSIERLAEVAPERELTSAARHGAAGCTRC